MPPRISPPHRLPTSPSSTCQCFCTRLRVLPEPIPISSQTRQINLWPKSKNTTKLRRDMYEWLEGPGKVFREPLPGSTNYMSAYDKQGSLLRTKRQRDDRQQPSTAVDEDVIPEEEEEEFQKQEKANGLDEKEIEKNIANRAAARQAKADVDARGGLPKERMQDLRPYPLNPNFRSQTVLSEDLREEVYRQVVERGMDITTVSAAFGIDMRRVAAVVRLKTIEKQWEAEKKPLAKVYNDAVLAMLPQTPYKPHNPSQQIFEHETVNDLPVHPSTRQQLFYPVSESRQFTREDAAKAFGDKLLPADKRIAHPQLITLEKEHIEGIPRQERWDRQRRRDAEGKEAKEKAEAKRVAWEQSTQRVVETRRWNFKFQDVSAEKTGKDGRARNAVGVRYGMPHEDRKRGMVKIPTSVE